MLSEGALKLNTVEMMWWKKIILIKQIGWPSSRCVIHPYWLSQSQVPYALIGLFCWFHPQSFSSRNTECPENVFLEDTINPPWNGDYFSEYQCKEYETVFAVFALLGTPCSLRERVQIKYCSLSAHRQYH